MVKRKTLAPMDNLFDQGYKLSYFVEVYPNMNKISQK